MHQPAGGIVNVDQKRAGWAAILKPGVLGAVDLDEFADAVAPVARLVHALELLPALLPETRRDHPASDRLDAQSDAVPLGELLAGERRAEIGIVGCDQCQHLGPQRRRVGAVAGLAAA
ncbi:hypothetical protein BB934_28560 (plasmid) [Microvirga ossetica]|uniref:Uncharacterized protein n=1 Tax=Microvirga ossetica TaxID=1882682 RepID=A0A1B2EQQ4_9HYPH|nr:hypothetical protein [Microvirga ossetica]ANY82279.1 hypothetical protein BB934_28560 [Microvirga ossetica]